MTNFLMVIYDRLLASRSTSSRVYSTHDFCFCFFFSLLVFQWKFWAGHELNLIPWINCLTPSSRLILLRITEEWQFNLDRLSCSLGRCQIFGTAELSCHRGPPKVCNTILGNSLPPSHDINFRGPFLERPSKGPVTFRAARQILKLKPPE